MRRHMMISLFSVMMFGSLQAITPDEALTRLLDGNKRYVQDRLLHPDRSAERREAVSSKQEPFAVVVGCSDSRVPPEIVFDQGVGDLFVVRVAGNVVGPVELDSIEYSVKYLHSSLIIILGHERCGAVDAVLSGNTADIEAVSNLIEPSIKVCKKECKEKGEDLLNLCIKSNAKNVADFVKNSPLIAKYVEEKKIAVIAGYYDLNTGKIEIL